MNEKKRNGANKYRVALLFQKRKRKKINFFFILSWKKAQKVSIQPLNFNFRHSTTKKNWMIQKRTFDILYCFLVAIVLVMHNHNKKEKTFEKGKRMFKPLYSSSFFFCFSCSTICYEVIERPKNTLTMLMEWSSFIITSTHRSNPQTLWGIFFLFLGTNEKK